MTWVNGVDYGSRWYLWIKKSLIDSIITRMITIEHALTVENVMKNMEFIIVVDKIVTMTWLIVTGYASYGKNKIACNLDS